MIDHRRANNGQLSQAVAMTFLVLAIVIFCMAYQVHQQHQRDREAHPPPPVVKLPACVETTLRVVEQLESKLPARHRAEEYGDLLERLHELHAARAGEIRCLRVAGWAAIGMLASMVRARIVERWRGTSKRRGAK